MRIFKNRGDIFFSKTDKERSAEQKFLISALVIIVVFSVIFITVTAVRSDFSIKKFFAPENIEVTQSAEEEAQSYDLPEISGKTNYIFTVNDEINLLFDVVVQADRDNIAYKASCLKAATVCDGKSLASIYSASGEENVKNAVESLLDITINYYIGMEEDDFISFYNELGEINYAVAGAIRFKDNDSASPYSVRIKEGEQSIKGSQITGLIRYYLDEENNTSAANEIFLSMLTQQINAENYENADDLFRQFISAAKTDITVREYSMSADALSVFSNEMTGVKVYNAPAEYEKNSMTEDSIKAVRGYFVN